MIEKARDFQKNIYFCFIDDAKAFDYMDHNKLWEKKKIYVYIYSFDYMDLCQQSDVSAYNHIISSYPQSPPSPATNNNRGFNNFMIKATRNFKMQPQDP